MLIDDNSFLGACVTIYGIKKYAKRDYDLIVYTWNQLSQYNKNCLIKLNNKIIFKDIPEKDYKNCKFADDPRAWGYNCAYRFEIFTLSQYKKIIYIDCDFLIQNDITELFLDDDKFKAVKTANDYLFQGNKQFNAGLLLIDNIFLKQKVKNELIQMCLTPAPVFNNSTLWLSDDPILNTYFKDVKYLKKKYNYVVTSLNNESHKNVNFHFNGPVKPWETNEFYNAFNGCFMKRFLNENGAAGLILLKKVFNLYNKQLAVCREIINT